MPGGDPAWSPRAPPSEASNADAPSGSASQDGFDPQQIQAMARHPPPGASVYSPNAAVSSAVNPRSCVTCRRRKVRCDKLMPCSNCRRAQIPCIFPAPGRAPRRPRPKDPNAPSKQPSSERELELMKRLRKLEGIVEELSGQIEIETPRNTSSASVGNSPESAPRKGIEEVAGRQHDGAASASGSSHGHGSPVTGPPTRAIGSSSGFGPLRKSSDVHRQFGRLVLNDKGVTRYVSSAFWTSINDELDEIRQETHELTEDDSDDYDIEASPQSAAQEKSLTDHQSFIMGYRSADVDLRPLHPLPSQIPFMWQVYQENVDPILKILHIPTTSKLIREVRTSLDNLTPPTEALMFSIYYAAITSLDEEEVKLNFGAEKDFLLQQYRFALEQALAKSNFVTSPDLTIAQAFILFLVLVRRHDDTRFCWTLTGLLIRVSQALGLHRDGTHFPNLSPFEIEIRRRCFWAVCVLDLRSAEDQGTDLAIIDGLFDTQIPLNINDSDLSPESTELPKPREGPADMTFSIIRYEICSVARRIHVASLPLVANVYSRDAASTLEEREAMLLQVHKRMEDMYLKSPDCDNNPMYWTAANIARLIVAKMTLIIYQSALFPGPTSEELTEEKRTSLFNRATEIFEYSYILNTDTRSKQWRWLFQTYTQLHAVAYVLIEVSHRPWSATVERSWSALNMVLSTGKPSLPQFDLEKMADHSAIWLPLRKLYLKAKRHREAEIARLRADPQATQQVELEDKARSPPESFGALANSVKNVIANEHWRKLVNAPPLPAPTPVQTASQQLQGGPISEPAMPGNDAEIDAQFVKPDVMEFLDSAMSANTFEPAFFPAMWTRASISLASQTPEAAYGISTSGARRMENMVPYDSTALLGDNARVMAPPSHTNTGNSGFTSTVSPLQDHNNLPPWMWPASDPPQSQSMPFEELDVNMDEGFDWQNWQENLGKYDLEGTGAGAAWGSGI
ncbi:fungal-specific transcription factor domain-containing protein [Cercophora newfieldiana]|uniref:Fungal-specific transcription factor domain-containing protein n=1 Tax=Cercophora newfieldiana TaxID=92897 RepID=A0AA39YSL5_9PEZI|nr:fungal-specific transcription factor domain-containing protein [Cercophora newfieldiana]